jgi:hypothetical protein
MKKIHLLLAAAALALLAPMAALAQSKDGAAQGPFIHIEVREHGGEAGSVNINLPLALAQIAVAAMQDSVSHQVSARLNHGDLKVSDLRKMWKAMRDAGQTEFVTVQEKGESVRIFREGDKVVVKVNEGDSKDKVRIQVPVTMMDALLGGEGEEVDLAAAVNELSRVGKGDLVTVDEGAKGDKVRIWIE